MSLSSQREIIQYLFEQSDSKETNIFNNEEGVVILNKYQLLVSRLMHPKNNINRLFLHWGTGTGKTIGSLYIGQQFLENGIENNSHMERFVFVLGFTSDIYLTELNSTSIFGISSPEEESIIKSTKYSKEDKQKTRERTGRRTYKNEKMDRFRFYGYMQLAQTIFTSDLSVIENITYEKLEEAIKDGRVTVNKQLLNSFKNSLIICDEIHNTYNQNENNSWGLAIQYILKTSKPKAVFVSATPIQNSVTEAVHLLNYLNEDDKIYKESDFFDENQNLKPEAEELIKAITDKKISYFAETNSNDFPDWKYEGIKIAEVGDFMKFETVKVSEEYEQILKTNVSYDNTEKLENTDFLDDINYKGFVNDLYLKSTDGRIVHSVRGLNENPNDTFIGASYRLTGSDREIVPLPSFDLKRFAPKYYRLCENLLDGIRKKVGKGIIYHTNVKTSGIKFISRVFENLGFIEYGNPRYTEKTICRKCARYKDQHSDKIEDFDITSLVREEKLSEIEKLVESKKYLSFITEELSNSIQRPIVAKFERRGKLYFRYQIEAIPKDYCSFSPVTFCMIHSKLPKHQTEMNLSRFNSPENANGENIMFLLGSRKISEALDFKAVRTIHIMNRPPDISTFIQIRGRAIRNKSHHLLPPEKRNVKIFVYVNMLSSGLSDEIYNYKVRIEKYEKIRKVENVIYQNSINMLVPEKDYSSLTFDLLFLKGEMSDIKRVVKSLFVKSNIWEVEDLIKEVNDWSKNNNWYMDTSFHEREHILYVINEMTYMRDNKKVSLEIGGSKLKNSFFSIISKDNYITIANRVYVIVPFVYYGKQYFKLELKESVEKSDIFGGYRDFKVYTETEDVDKFVQLETKIASKTKNLDYKEFLKNAVDIIVEVDELHSDHKYKLIKYLEDEKKIYDPNTKIKDIDPKTLSLLYIFYVYMGFMVIQVTDKEIFTQRQIALIEKLNNGTYFSESKIFSSKRMPTELSEFAIELKDKISHIGNISFIKPIKYEIGENSFILEDKEWKQFRQEYKENEVIIGYDHKDDNSNTFKFKLREPKHLSEVHVDNRLKSRGQYYKHFSIAELKEFFVRLGIADEEIANADKTRLGMKLRLALIKMDRNSKDGTKYFYSK